MLTYIKISNYKFPNFYISNKISESQVALDNNSTKNATYI